MIVTFAAGGGADFVARTVASKMTESLGKPVIVENRAGSGGLIGDDVVAKAAPDGYTLLMGAAGPLTVAPHLYTRIPYDPKKDLIPVALVVSGGQFPYKSGGIKWRRHLAASVEVGINQTGAEQAPVTFS